jgi:hypothetical protein
VALSGEGRHTFRFHPCSAASSISLPGLLTGYRAKGCNGGSIVPPAMRDRRCDASFGAYFPSFVRFVRFLDAKERNVQANQLHFVEAGVDISSFVLVFILVSPS